MYISYIGLFGVGRNLELRSYVKSISEKLFIYNIAVSSVGKLLSIIHIQTLWRTFLVIFV